MMPEGVAARGGEGCPGSQCGMVARLSRESALPRLS